MNVYIPAPHPYKQGFQMGISKKQAHARAKGLKEKIARIEQDLRMPIMDKKKRGDLEYDLARLKKQL